MDRKRFFDALRRRESGLFGTSLSAAQVQGTDALLDGFERHDVRNPHHAANIMAQVYRETGGYMRGIKETVMPYHKDKNPSDATVIARLDNAWKKGVLGKVKTPYWRDGAFGRGPIQLTHWENYDKFGRRLGIPLRKNPSLALDLKHGADIAIVGMVEGMFRNRKLSGYVFPRDLDNPPDTNPRRIVNGKDGSDAEVAKSHRAFFKALTEAGFGTEKPVQPRQPDPAPIPVPSPKPSPVPKPKGKTGIIAAVVVALAAGWAWMASLPCSLFNVWCG
jgi:hypothetical protein